MIKQNDIHHTKRVLFVQHAGALGGSAISLLHLVKPLKEQSFEPIVACIHPNPVVLDLYRNVGIEAFYWPGIKDFMHTTGGWYPIYNPISFLKLLNRAITFRSSSKSMRKLISHVRPDIIHLNSLVLPSCAVAAQQAGIPLVWHIRESVVRGHLGIRRWWLGRLVKHMAEEAIFISSDGRKLLVNNETGVVIPNYVDAQRFDMQINGTQVRTELGLSLDHKVILFMGGRSPIKGIFPLLEAISIVCQQIPNVRLIIAAGVYRPSGRLASKIARFILPVVRYGTVAQRVDKLIDKYSIHEYLCLLTWCSDIPRLLAACDVLVFPSTAPHFARPIIEAGAMGKPVVASRIGGVEELVVDGETGILVPPDNAPALAAALIQVLQSPDDAIRMGCNGHKRVYQFYDIKNNVRQIISIYRRLTDRS